MCVYAQYDGGDFGERLLYSGPDEPHHAIKFIKDRGYEFKCLLADAPKFLFRKVGPALQIVICCPEHSPVCVAKFLRDL